MEDAKQDGAVLKETLKRIIGPQWQYRVHRLSRLRWLTKFRLMRGFSADVGVRRQMAYVLFDPETESFSYELDDELEVLRALAGALGTSEAELIGYAAETRCDPELNELFGVTP